ncbi:16S rRNA (cytidine(1402)-2'-O)-methyltransferase [Mycoplasma sp. 744]|uniref:16S rRNA (cytidine(1402)-2'-O)-methyltransferase n=1 Tax=Mycoplasma sp. 744 TaxID=3108531 RepID=UPI002B1E8765|nr:16S rRNA (cytidine(1402)-2'-O)-methyltransferase [Mycoplasma sp. 744]MEA4115685.1 16S rRNA (cytidine(1402)-2'-O)-methyltransferase [Mycoplasma sp. 744]
MSKIFLVATPIGNMKDITYRAVETLKNVDYIACEDTRVAQKLLNYWNIQKKLFIYNKFNENNSAKGLIDLILKENKSLALISDAGMPLISDPGFNLVKLAREKEINIELIPGVNAAITAMALSGFTNEFVFHGFPKEKTQQKKDQLENLDHNFSHIFYIAPHKLINLLELINNIWKDKAKLFLCKELTKIYEQHFYGTAEEILNDLKKTNIKGEYTLVIYIKSEKKVKINKYASYSKVD